jgi:hypothetical protein
LGLLPPIGLEIPMRGQAVNVPLKIDGMGVVTLDFQGTFMVRVEENLGGGLGGVKMRVIRFRMKADHDDLGMVGLAGANEDTTPLSLLEVVSNLPPAFRSTLFLNWELTTSRPAGGNGPLTLSTTQTAALIHDHLTVFPPQSAGYQLQQPADHAPVDNPGQVTATLLEFPVTLSHNP